ncbi:hypothetical protein CHS0354_034755 [Potamilus streckersoni]|uniref:Uncharacterized protein n=1 Tax=Potamilus streckersoni TaxID=2493646 RepID=A0AAE0RSW2_9BIVA|nr:hypothetical protein CHS0354_034755 [Potamilus streckersoni]
MPHPRNKIKTNKGVESTTSPVSHGPPDKLRANNGLLATVYLVTASVPRKQPTTRTRNQRTQRGNVANHHPTTTLQFLLFLHQQPPMIGEFSYHT